MTSLPKVNRYPCQPAEISRDCAIVEVMSQCDLCTRYPLLTRCLSTLPIMFRKAAGFSKFDTLDVLECWETRIVFVILHIYNYSNLLGEHVAGVVCPSLAYTLKTLLSCWCMHGL